MDVTLDNFRGAVHLLQRIVPGAAFVAIDFEFTGLGFSRPSNLDTPQYRYEVAREDARIYPPLQFGLSIFHDVSAATTSKKSCDQHFNNLSPASTFTPNWHATTFNFNLHPRPVYFPHNQRYPLIDKEIRFQSSTIHFLSSHGFDFTKNFNLGISWLRSHDETFLRKTVTENLNSRRNPKYPVRESDISEKDAAFVSEFKENLDRWISENDHPPAQTSKPPPKVVLLEFPRTPMARRLVFDLIRQNYPRIACLVCNLPEGLRLRIALHASAQLAERHRQRDLNMEIEQIVMREVGARLIFDVLRQNQVTVVVHHGLIDLTKLYANFVDDLPPELSEFKEQIKEIFPHVYDTKWAIEHLCALRSDFAKLLPQDPYTRYELSDYSVALRQIARDNKLHHALDIKTFIPKKRWYEIELDENLPLTKRLEHIVVSEYDQDWDEEADELGFSRYMSEEGEFTHEAGFDALETGVLFVLLQAVAEDQMNPVENKVYLSSCGGFKHIDLNAKEDANVWYDLNTVIISGAWNKEGRDHRCRKILRHVVRGTAFDAEKSEFVIVHKTQFISVLKLKDGYKPSSAKEEMLKVISQGQEANLSVVPYQRQYLINCAYDANNEENFEMKRRKLA